MSVAVDTRVLELLCSRICHDLVSPVGAINNGVELMEELEGDMAGEAINLVAESGRKAAARLRCFRLAYGVAGGQAGVPLEDGRLAATDYLAGGKISLSWPTASPSIAMSVPAGTVKMLLNLVMLAEEALSYGGAIAVELPDAGGGTAVVSATGRAATLNDPSLAALKGDAAVTELTARTVHAYVTGLLARQYKMPIDAVNPEPSAPQARLALRLHLPEV
ncbi:MAG: hypothetical protein H6842_14465 [Rhodospirillaceae bacterium]|nr:hypothetical protein [Rhodospirillaceae bacterium]